VSPRVLMACYEVPGYGGASTASYRLFETLQPDVLLADDFIATLLLKRASPHTRLIFMTAGLAQVAEYLRHRQGTGPFRVEEFLRAARGGLKVFAPRERGRCWQPT